ncbi:uncharacterized protein LOC125241717 [Leguminivora glycinivorella]|uniref:uncharacterized protein LOC125241717 n=1 Tax=Leguminivora glycinivorella TaxID=1035111 RepID=UPI00200CDCFF|nr:uncharacterized protein LOC125241717 [Leguminivora glycinivorella]
MTIKLIFIGVALAVASHGAGGSVVGVTYHDDFDFEQRYRRVHECDPFYWHPLHLPEECADMYEQLIRNRLPVRIPKPPDRLYRPRQLSPVIQSYSYNPVFQTVIEKTASEEEENPVFQELTPYEEMLESVQKDVNNFPSVPSVRNMPNFGPVAVYQQPISQISADMIKKVAMTYIHSADDKDDNKKKKRHRSRKSGGKWKELVSKVRAHERKGWKKINNGEFVSIAKP